jgi:TP901 family phage tail tape measure protein
MPGTYQYDVEIKSNVVKLLSDMKQVQDRLDNVEGKEYKIKLNVDEKKLSSVISNLEKMLDSLGKGTGDFKQFENLSKELSNIVSEVQSLSKAFGKVDDSGAKTLLSSIQNIDKSLSELSQNILNVNKNMSNMGGNTSGAVKQVENISNAYQDAAKEAEKLADAQSKIGQKTNISSASTESVTNSIKEENNALEQNTQKVKENTQAKEQNANINLNKYDKRLDSYNGKVDKYQATIDRFNDGGWTSKTYLENVQAVRDAVKQYATLLDNIKTNQNGIASDEDIQNLDKYEKKIKETIATVTNMSASEKGYNFVSGQKELDKIHKLLAENSKMSSEAKNKIRAYYREIESGNPSMSLDKIHGEIMKIYNAEVEAGRAGRSFFDTLKNSGFHQLAAQMAGMFGFYDVINLGKEGLNVVRELNTALTEMRKVSDETVQSLKDYQATTFDTADAVGTTAKQIQNSTADWMRLGESMNQAAESAKDANVLLNVSEFEGIDEATESLVSMSQAYKDLDKMDIIDVLNNIGNNYSISTDGLATALKDSASALVTANNDLNEAVSLTTAGNAITQDPSKVGAGLRTISLRLVGTEEAKQELSDLGEETDGMITTVSKLRDTIMDATKAASSDGKGFDILDSNGNYKSTYEIMQGLADLYDNIVKKDKELGTNNLNLLLETIAGKNRANIAASILQNGDMLRSVYEDAQNSEGSAEKELNSYLDSIDGKMAQLENRAQEFWFKVIDSETIKNGIDLLSTLLKGATDFVDTIGLLPTIFTTISGYLGSKNLGWQTKK